MKEEELKQELKKINDEIDTHTKNLIVLLKTVNIEFINLIQYHYTFNTLINKRKEIENELFFYKMNND